MRYYSGQLSELLGRDIEIWAGPGSPSHASIVYELIVEENPHLRYVGQTSNLGRRLEGHKYQLEKFTKSCTVHDTIRRHAKNFRELKVKLHAIPTLFLNYGYYNEGVNLFERYMIHKYGTLNWSQPKVIQRLCEKKIIDSYEKSLA